jgi:hypothetical protein
MSLKSPKDPRVAHHYADLGEVLLHYVTAGEGPPSNPGSGGKVYGDRAGYARSWR